MGAFCTECGTPSETAFCATCGAAAAGQDSARLTGTAPARAQAQAVGFQVNIGANRSRVAGPPLGPPPIDQMEGNDISPHLVRRWNWGGFLLPAFWPFWHGLPWLGVAVILCALLSVAVVPAIIGLGIAVYLGIKGGELAVRGRLYGTDEEFMRVEKAWTVGGMIALVASIPLWILGSFLSFLEAGR